MLYISYEDIRFRRIPNLAVLLLTVFIIVYLLSIYFYSSYEDWLYFWSEHFLGAVIGFAVFVIPATKGRSVGFGDVKIACSLGLLIGAWNMLHYLFVSLVICALCGIGITFYRKIKKKPDMSIYMPLAPFMSAGLIVMLENIV